MNMLLDNVNLEMGLSDNEALKRLDEYGPNSLPEGKRQSSFSIFIAQLKSPLVYVLLVAGLVTLLLREYTDSMVIFLAVFLNTIFGYIQEQKAGKALEALQKLVHPHARVIRNGEIGTIEIEKLVIGDVVFLSQGDKIPADGKVFDASRFYTSEAILTGESVSVEKKNEDSVFMGTSVAAGTAKMLVTMTGKDTEMGKIAASVTKISGDTPLREQLKKFSKQLSLLVVSLTVLVLVMGLLLGLPPVEIFTTSVALAVSAIPEGLLVALTVILALGMQRILARKGLVRDLVSAETLGSVTTICIDKTGTLTEGRMQVVDAVGSEYDLALQVLIANDVDDPMLISALEWGKEKIPDANAEEGKHTRLDSIPFSSHRGYFASLNRWDDENNVIFVNGSPEILLERSNMNDSERSHVMDNVEILSRDGKRVIGLARKIMPVSQNSISEEYVENNLSWIGLLAFSDPVRSDVRESLDLAMAAGIRIIVITGDYSNTALAVLSQLGLDVSSDEVITGASLENYIEDELRRRLLSPKTLLFARTRPDQKLKIVETLKDMGEVVAMMGDGVNDAPALSQSDIGIVVNEASDVAKESASLVLLDSRFSTIVAAIEEGRGIFDNMRKVILYLMCGAFVEIFVVLAALVLRLPLPLVAAQILWINLVTDGFPSLALTVDPRVSGSMRRKPRSPREPLISGWLRNLIAIVSIVSFIITFGVFIYVYKKTGDEVLARSVAFAMVGVNSLFYVFSVRMLQEPFWKGNFFANRWLLLSVFVGLLLQILPFTIPDIRKFFGTSPLGNYWIVVLVLSVLMFFMVEISKWGFRHHLKHNGNNK